MQPLILANKKKLQQSPVSYCNCFFANFVFGSELSISYHCFTDWSIAYSNEASKP